MSRNKEKLTELRDLFENGLITEEEYESRKKELLDSFLADKDESQTKGEHIGNSKTRSIGGNKLIIAIIAVLCIAALLLLGTKLFNGNNSHNSSLDSKDTIEKNLLLGSYEQSGKIVAFAKDGTFYIQKGQSTKVRGYYYVNEKNDEVTLVEYKYPEITCKYKYFFSDDTLVLEEIDESFYIIEGALKRNGEAPETAFDINPDPAIIIGNHFLDEYGWHHYYFGEDGYYFEEKNSLGDYFGYEGSYEIDGNKLNVKKVNITSSYGKPEEEEETYEFEFFDGHVILYERGLDEGQYLQNWDPAENDSSIYDSEKLRSWSTYFSDMLYEEDPNAGFSGEYEEDPNAGFSGETENYVDDALLEDFKSSSNFGKRFVDLASVFTTSEVQEMENYLNRISENLKFDITAVFIDKGYDFNQLLTFADDFYDYGGYGMGEEYSGCMLAVDMGSRIYTMSTCGWGITALTDYGLEYIYDDILGYAKDGDWVGAINRGYADNVETFVKSSYEGKIFDNYGSGYDNYGNEIAGQPQK